MHCDTCAGGYVNFGVFRLYGDTALDNALNIFVKLLLSIPQPDLLVRNATLPSDCVLLTYPSSIAQNFPKLSQTFYVLLECLAQDHMNFLASLEPHVFLYILSSISEGLNALDTMVCTGCCATLDHIVTYLFKWISKNSKKSPRDSTGVVREGSELTWSSRCSADLVVAGEACLKVLEVHPEILQQMLSTILNIIMFEDCRNQWSMSRPLLGLILLNEDYFQQLRQSIIQAQPLDKQSAMVAWFDSLMDGIERNLLTKNRDR